METKLQENLRPGEKLLWSARPESCKALDEAHKKSILCKSAVILLCIAALSAWYFYTISNSRHSMNPIEILACLSPILCVWTDFSDVRKLKKQVVYGLTDQRMLTVNGKQLYSLDYSQISCYDVLTDAAGHASLICGEVALNDKEDTRRSASVTVPAINVDTNECEKFAMYGVTEHADEIKKILSNHAA